MRDSAQQVTCQEYQQGQGIGPHVDIAAFGPEIVTISLLSSCVVRFACGERTFRQALEPRSALALSGPARENWTHEIPARTVTARRISITFRTMSAG